MFHLPAFFFFLALYFLPTLIASGRHLHNRAPIAVFNLFLGWTFIGWLAALIWAIASPPPYVVYVQPPPYRPYR